MIDEDSNAKVVAVNCDTPGPLLVGQKRVIKSVDSPRYPNTSVVQFLFMGKLKWFLLVDHGCGESHT
ncbi:hypothetical protein MTR_6g012960 [Medicago truncatula]|uniref:Uncharacterized protein n=1 Tax=Medicago truncatula TaxID=3880 RepID=G7KLB0_MEDTR|nr:hypothetical protein MTR_6g012960 [Medicago truncatula]